MEYILDVMVILLMSIIGAGLAAGIVYLFLVGLKFVMPKLDLDLMLGVHVSKAIENYKKSQRKLVNWNRLVQNDSDEDYYQVFYSQAMRRYRIAHLQAAKELVAEQAQSIDEFMLAFAEVTRADSKGLKRDGAHTLNSEPLFVNRRGSYAEAA